MEKMAKNQRRFADHSDQFYSAAFKKKDSHSSKRNPKLSRRETFMSYKVSEYKFENPRVGTKNSTKTARVKFGGDISNLNLEGESSPRLNNK